MEHVHGLNRVHVIAVPVRPVQHRHRRVAERHLVAVGRMVRGRIRVRLGITCLGQHVKYVQIHITVPGITSDMTVQIHILTRLRHIRQTIIHQQSVR